MLRKQNPTQKKHKMYKKPRLTQIIQKCTLKNKRLKNQKPKTTELIVRTVHLFVHITVHNCCTQHITEQF